MMGRADQRTEPVKRQVAIMYAAKLAALGARPPTISGLLPYLSETTIKDIWAEVRGERSKRGPTPYQISTHFATPRSRIQATYALVLFVEYRKTGIHDIDAIIATYERYSQRFDTTTDPKGLSFDRLVKLVGHYINDGSVTLERCPGCGMLHIHDVHEILRARNCPLRKLIPEFCESEATRPLVAVEPISEPSLAVSVHPMWATKPAMCLPYRAN